MAAPEVRALYEGIVEELNRNLARFEKLKRVLLVADEFSAENGTLTASMKLRRRVVEERYRQQIEEMYEQAEEAGPGRQPSEVADCANAPAETGNGASPTASINSTSLWFSSHPILTFAWSKIACLVRSMSGRVCCIRALILLLLFAGTLSFAQQVRGKPQTGKTPEKSKPAAEAASDSRICR